jgi:hypothetical protein
MWKHGDVSEHATSILWKVKTVGLKREDHIAMT